MAIMPDDDMERSAPQTESAQERGYNVKTDNRKYGTSDHDIADSGDIADEGAGHRDVAPTGQRTPGSAEGERDRSEQSK